MQKSICPVPHVTRRRKRLFTLCTLLVAVLFVFYQLKILYIVSHQETASSPLTAPLIRGVHPKNQQFYVQFSEGKFKCFKSGEMIAFSKVNDDYCDCEDSTDEPGTNACSDGTFYCDSRKNPAKIPSSMVNDGICDCCDGSDEFSTMGQTGQTPCRNVC